MSDKKIRINKYLASMGLASRRQIDTWITDGRIMINGVLAEPGDKITVGVDEIIVDKKKIVPKDTVFEYWKIYKPRGVVSTAKDTHGRPNVVKMAPTRQRVYPVGRLDVDSEGLMILTNDGDFANKLTHPKYHVAKTYLVWVFGSVTVKRIKNLQTGVRLGNQKTAPADVTVYSDGIYYDVNDLGKINIFKDIRKILNINSRTTQLKITLHEGKKRQIRRMCSAVGLEVDRLKRISIGNLEIGDMRAGDVKKIKKDMI